MFNSKKEFAQAMMDGGVYEYSGCKCYYDESFTVPFRILISGDTVSCELDGFWENYNKVKKVTQWYENIPENGRLCWVWDDDCSSKDVTAIFQYGVRHDYPFMSNRGVCWKNAKPLTDEEIKAFLQGDKND